MRMCLGNILNAEGELENLKFVDTIILEYFLTKVNRFLGYFQASMREGGECVLFENIVTLCKSRNISISKLEKEVGFGNATIRAWETSSPSIDRVKLVADFFGVSIDCLISNHMET